MLRSRVAGGVVAALVASVFVVGGAASSATAGDPGAISGTVTVPGGAAAAGVIVSAHYPETGENVSQTETDSAGHYTLAALDQGDYQLRFEPSDSAYAPEWWDNAITRDTASPIAVVGGSTTTGRDVVLAPTVTISGTVRNVSAVAIPNVQVVAYATGGQSDENWLGSATTDSAGHYAITGLAARDYTLKFRDILGSYGQEWWNDQHSYATATFFSTVAATTHTRDATLANGGSITGRVTSAPTIGLGGIIVRALTADGDEITQATTISTGYYTLSGLGAGDYVLQFVAPDDSPYATKWYENAASRADADSVAVAAGTTTTDQDVQLELGSSIAGTVRAANSGEALAGFVVLLYSANDISANLDSLLEITDTDPAGGYHFDHLPIGGDYKIAVVRSDNLPITPSGAPIVSEFDWVTQWYSGKYSYATGDTTTIVTQGSSFDRDVYMELPYFADATDPSSPFYESIEWMAAANISLGTPNEHGGRAFYRPLDSVSRQAMAVFLYRFSQETFTPPATASFADVPVGHPFFTAIEWMKAKGISVGTPQPSGLPLFKPADPVSRQAMASFLVRFSGDTLPSGEPSTQSFADVPTNATTARAIEWMKNTGISVGTAQPSGLPLYKPADPVSRQSMAVFLLRLSNYMFPI